MRASDTNIPDTTVLGIFVMLLVVSFFVSIALRLIPKDCCVFDKFVFEDCRSVWLSVSSVFSFFSKLLDSTDSLSFSTITKH